MPEYEWVFKKEYKPVKAELENVIQKVVKIMRDKYDTPGIEYQLIGSGNRHLITRIKGGNKGFDLDYNSKSYNLCDSIKAEFGKIKEENPNSEQAKFLVKKLQNFITTHYYTCTDEIMISLGQMYVASGDMTANIDKYAGEGTAVYFNEAIKACIS